MWRKIFFSLSRTSTKKKSPVTLEAAENQIIPRGDDTPQIDIKRLVDFLHTREYSSKKVSQDSLLWLQCRNLDKAVLSIYV